MGKNLKIITSSKCDILISQFIPNKYTHSYYTFPCIFNGKKYGITWQTFRKKIYFFWWGWYLLSMANCE